MLDTGPFVNNRTFEHVGSSRSSHLGPLPRDPDRLAGLSVAALQLRRPDQVDAEHLVDLLLIVVHTLQRSSLVSGATRLAALWYMVEEEKP